MDEVSQAAVDAVQRADYEAFAGADILWRALPDDRVRNMLTTAAPHLATEPCCLEPCDPDCENGPVHCVWFHIPSHKPGWHPAEDCPHDRAVSAAAAAERARLAGDGSHEALGQLVREVWAEWAQEQPDPKPSWLTGWDDLDAGQREVDIRIGKTVIEIGKALGAVAERERIAAWLDATAAHTTAAKVLELGDGGLSAELAPALAAALASVLAGVAELLRDPDADLLTPPEGATPNDHPTA